MDRPMELNVPSIILQVTELLSSLYLSVFVTLSERKCQQETETDLVKGKKRK